MDLKKITEFIKNKNNRILIIILIIGTIIMLIPTKKKTEEPVEKESIVEYDDSERLAEIISHIDGVGKAEVMVTYSKTAESVLAFDTKSEKTDKKDSGADESLDKQAIMSDGSPVILAKTYPKVKGVVVIAKGCDNPETKAAILDAVTTAFDIAPHKVCILNQGA